MPSIDEKFATEPMLKLGSPTELPPRPFLDIGVRARFAWELWRARGEI
ncbi:hypothetical protein [Ochrobactrum sp. Marseille-Q0166]|nr:hypothetical protein [Ochrobactrum sp. Marseille-Q0166]MBC8716394.1 hypothetical protein [Ochrobactrum sp. Marseille-Q0166]